MANIVIRMTKRRPSNQRVNRTQTGNSKVRSHSKNIELIYVQSDGNCSFSGSMRPGKNKGQINI